MKCAISSQISSHLSSQDKFESMMEDIEENLIPKYMEEFKKRDTIRIADEELFIGDVELDPELLENFLIRNYAEIYSEY